MRKTVRKEYRGMKLSTLFFQLPSNDPAVGLARGLIRAWELYGNERAAVLFLGDKEERNKMDQKWLEVRMHELNPNVPVLWRKFENIIDSPELMGDKNLIVDGCEVAVVYFRVGYVPSQYLTEQHWEARLKIERSRAIKCPSIQYHLAGAKKIQQELSLPGQLERFFSDKKTIARIRQTFVNQYSLDEGPEGDRAVDMAIHEPKNYVLKPQREGGGHNYFGEEMKTFLEKNRHSDDRAGYILMERIFPWPQKNHLMKYGESTKLKNVVNEIGVYGVYLGSETEEIENKLVGHLMRTKEFGADEGGICAGVSLLDTPLLIETNNHGDILISKFSQHFRISFPVVLTFPILLLSAGSVCEFDRGDLCGWQLNRTSPSGSEPDQTFVWKTDQASTASTLDYRPKLDYSGHSSGWYLWTDSSLGNFHDATEIFTPFINNVGPQCMMSFRYYMSGRHTGSLSVFLKTRSHRTLYWTADGGSRHSWQRAQLAIGMYSNFQVVIQARRGRSFLGDIAIDDVEFSDCPPPEKVLGGCATGQVPCENGYCVAADRVCDFGNDCGDQSDEGTRCTFPSSMLVLASSCDFEHGICATWKNDKNDDFDWTLSGGTTPNSNTGPGVDHTKINSPGERHDLYQAGWKKYFSDDFGVRF
ncbi:hypothetical protein ScPMuIL_000816 [Solemya velum]